MSHAGSIAADQDALATDAAGDLFAPLPRSLRDRAMKQLDKIAVK